MGQQAAVWTRIAKDRKVEDSGGELILSAEKSPLSTKLYNTVQELEHL